MKSISIAALLVAVLLAFSIFFFVFLNVPTQEKPVTPQNYGYTIVNIFPHDNSAFTEGLIYSDGFLYESTGLNRASSLRRVNLTSGEVLEEIHLSDEFFGEGIAIVGDRIIQLTYVSHVGFIYDKTSFALLGNFTYSTEGWGLTYNGKDLIMSDGSDTLRFLDPISFQQKSQVHVHYGNTSVTNINELEYINGDVYANIFLQKKIAIINPQTGQVKAWVDLSGLPGPTGSDPEKVLNGIAYDSKNDRLFVTGKDWPQLYEIKLVSAG